MQGEGTDVNGVQESILDPANSTNCFVDDLLRLTFFRSRPSAGMIHLSGKTAELAMAEGYSCESRGEIEVGIQTLLPSSCSLLNPRSPYVYDWVVDPVLPFEWNRAHPKTCKPKP